MHVPHFDANPPRIEIMPIIDVVFLLLVVFIYAMLSMAVHKGLPVDLPISQKAPVDGKTSLAVTIDAAGNVFVNQKPVLITKLVEVLRAVPDEDKETGLLLFADKKLVYRDLFQVMELIRQGGITRISLQAETDLKK